MSKAGDQRTDAATSAVIREQLISVVREMRRSMVQSSYSSIIYEGYDFSCVLIDGHGRLIAESGEDHPFHIIPVAGAIEGALAVHGAIGPDDLLLHNDPYTGGTHLNDVAVIWPVHADGMPIFYVVVRSHWGDVGGMTPGSLNGAATDILQEGLRMNYLKLGKSGHSELLRLILDNVRATAEATADFQAVLGICRVAERRLRDLVARHGMATVQAATDDILDASERRMRAAISALQPGEYRHVGYLDGNEATPHPLEVHVRLVIEAEGIVADFTGSSAQVAAPLNAGPAIAPTSVMTVIKSFLDPSGPITSGTLRAVRVITVPGTIVNARSPAPCGGLNEVRFGCDAALMGALGQAIPDRMTPGTSAAVRDLADRMKAAAFGMVFFGGGLIKGAHAHRHVEALLQLVTDLNAGRRFYARRMRRFGDIAGADSVLTWQTGYPFGVNFFAGYPRFNPGEFSAPAMLARGEADACLFVGSETTAEFPQAAIDHLRTIPVIALENPNTVTMAPPAVRFTTAVYGVHRPGTAYRMDEIPIPLQVLLPTDYPSDGTVLEMLRGAMLSESSRAPARNP